MSKDRKKLLHIHSSVNDKQPTPATLELGELGVNNAKGNAFISTKNSDGEVVRFSEDETIIGWMEQKEVFPYEGYMRGADNSQVDGVTEQDLLDNKSNLIIKLNQVVPENTDYSPYDEKVNGAKDIYGNLINPISAGSYKDGAGLAIDMSKYAMIGANPSFSSITTTCHATLNGTTEIKGKGDGCGSKFTVEVANACIDATDTLNEYGVNHSNFGTSCDGTKISNDTTLKGKKIFIDSPSGNLTVDIQACNHISGRTNDFVIRECQDNGGKVEIDTTDIDVSASTTDVKSCDRISAITNDFQVKECAANGKAGISSTTINNSASTIDEKACTRISESTNQFNITECTDGQGTTTIKSCKKFNVKSNDIVLEQCGNSGKTHIHSCAGITLESKNITLTDGDCGSGQTTIEVNDLCLVGERKINVYGDETNVGLDCDDSKIATNTRVFGNGTLITTKATPTTYAGENNIETVAAQDIKENADRDINETAGRNINETATGNINESTTNGNINESAKNINNTASNDICDTAANNASFYGANETNIGKSCDGSISENITYWRNSEQVCKDGVVGFSATTVDDALDEVYHRSQVSMTSTGNTSGIDVPVPDTGTSIVRSGSTTYTIHQDSDGCDKTYDFTVDNTIVSMSAYTYGADEELAKKYSFWQYIGDKRVEIGEINIPKDHILKDASIVNGHASGESFTACTAGDNTCHWYIKLVWNVFDPKTGHADDKIVYLPADDFVQDLVVNNPTNNGVCLDIWYDGQKKNISAHTEVHMIHGNNSTDTKYTITDGCKNSLTSYTLNSVSGDVKTAKAATNWTYDPFNKKVTISAATDASHINRKTVSWTYGDVKSAAGASYDPGDGTVNTFGNTRTMSFVIPQSVDNINRGKLTYTHNGFSGTFDPATDTEFTSPHSALTISYGNPCNSARSGITYNTSADKSIIVPQTIADITNGKVILGGTCDSPSCLTITSDICMENNTIAARAFYSKSDESLKENIESINDQDISKVNNVYFKSFNFKDDETKTKTYGVIAQSVKASGLDNIVHKDESGTLNVDYISLLILKIASLEQKIEMLRNELNGHKFYGK